MACSLLKDVNQSSHKWKVLVRLARVWEFANTQNLSDVYHLDFIMLDKQGDMMEGLVPQKWLHKFVPLLKEGSVYEIEYFEVLKAKETYRSVDTNSLVRFTKYTRVNEILPEPDAFPVYAYNAVPFSILNNRIGKTTLLSDTVVLITGVSPVIDTTTRLGPTVKRTINISDGSQTGMITLWGHHAHAFKAEALKTISHDTPIVALFVGMLVSTYSGKLALQSTSACKWYINIPIPEIRALRSMIESHSHQIEWQGDHRAQIDPVNTTVHELIGLIPNESLGQPYKVTILIRDLVPNQSWWYISCSSCWKKTFADGDGYKCRRCGVKTAEPRYKINMYATDPDANEEDKPVVAEFMFFGDVGQDLLGRPPMLLVAAAEGQKGYLPAEIKAVIGRRYEVIVEMTEGSLQSDEPTFRVRSILAQPDLTERLLPDKIETLSSVHHETQEEMTHEGHRFPIPLTPPPATAVLAMLTSPSPTPAVIASSEELAPSTHSEKRTHEEAIMSKETELSDSSRRPHKRPIHGSEKLKAAKELFPNVEDNKPHE